MKAIWNAKKGTYEIEMTTAEIGTTRFALTLATTRAPEDEDITALYREFQSLDSAPTEKEKAAEARARNSEFWHDVFHPFS